MTARPPWGGPKFKLQRNASITAAVLRGATLAAMAQQHGLTQERVRQIVARMCNSARRVADDQLRAEMARGTLGMRKVADRIIALLPGHADEP